MDLKYTKFEQLTADGISLNSINNAFSKLIENDNEIIKVNESKPSVWKCKWYNNDEIGGYQKGSLVWLNTENIQDLVERNFDDIRHIVIESEYRSDYENISSNIDQVNLLFRNICNGSDGYRRLYYIGELSAPTQMRISLIDNNKNIPSDSDTWADVFRLSSVESYEKIINDSSLSVIDKSISSHIQNYHLSSYSFEEISGKYLLNDFSNVSKTQSMITHNINGRGQTTQGFDKILIYDRITDGENSQWFRLWNSGLLEHGGILEANNYVNLSWERTNKKKSVIYDFSPYGATAYAENTELSVGDDSVEINPLSLGGPMVYNISITPICEKYGLKNSVETYNEQNSCFYYNLENTNVNKISYYTSGFITFSSVMRAIGK